MLFATLTKILVTYLHAHMKKQDTRLLLHAADCAKHGHKNITIWTVDIDVLVIAVVFELLVMDQLWIAFGMRKQFRYIPVHDIVKVLGPEKLQHCQHSMHLQGATRHHHFAGRGKNFAWGTMEIYSEVTAHFQL